MSPAFSHLASVRGWMSSFAAAPLALSANGAPFSEDANCFILGMAGSGGSPPFGFGFGLFREVERMIRHVRCDMSGRKHALIVVG